MIKRFSVIPESIKQICDVIKGHVTNNYFVKLLSWWQKWSKINHTIFRDSKKSFLPKYQL